MKDKRKELEKEASVVRSGIEETVARMMLAKQMGLSTKPSVNSEHKIKTKKFVQHFKAVIGKMPTKKDRHSVMQTSKTTIPGTSIIKWNEDLVKDSIGYQMEKRHADPIDR